MTSIKRWFGAGAIVLVAFALIACPSMVPKVTSEIPDMQFAAGATAAKTVNLASYFDVDRNALYEATSSDPAVAAALVEDATLTVTPKGPGTANVTVTASKNGSDPVSQSFSVTVAEPDEPDEPDAPPVNEAPLVRTIPDISLQVEGTKTRELSKYYLDPEGDELAYTAESSADAVATVSEPDEDSMITITAVGEGTATITVSASDGENAAVSQTFDVEVVAKPVVLPPVNNPPVIRTFISDVSLQVDGTKMLTLSHFYLDADALTYAADSSADAIATVSDPDASSMITITAVAEGTATITVSASDGVNDAVPQMFQVTVTPAEEPVAPDPNQPPTSDRIPDQSLTVVDDPSKDLDLSMYFDDADRDELTYDAASDNEAAVTADVAGSMLTITAVAAGEATITVFATDGKSARVSRQFDVTVKPESNKPPTAVAGISLDVIVMAGGAAKTINVSGYFSDPEDDALTYSAASDDDAIAMANVVVGSSMLTVTPVAGGTTTVTVTASDNMSNDGVMNASASIMLNVTVSPEPVVPIPNDPPTVQAGMVTDVSLTAGGTETKTLSMYYVDADSDPLTYTADSSDDTVAMVSDPDANSMITITAVAAGSADITVTATDGKSDPVSLTFSVMVAAIPPANQPSDEERHPGPVHRGWQHEDAHVVDVLR